MQLRRMELAGRPRLQLLRPFVCPARCHLRSAANCGATKTSTQRPVKARVHVNQAHLSAKTRFDITGRLVTSEDHSTHDFATLLYMEQAFLFDPMLSSRRGPIRNCGHATRTSKQLVTVDHRAARATRGSDLCKTEVRLVLLAYTRERRTVTTSRLND